MKIQEYLTVAASYDSLSIKIFYKVLMEMQSCEDYADSKIGQVRVQTENALKTAQDNKKEQN